MLMRLCNHIGCRQWITANEKYCSEHKEQHKPKPKLKRTPRKKYKNDKFYHSKQWSKLRKMHLVQEPFCRSCKARGIYKAAQMVDHIRPINDGGAKLDDANLQSLCFACHNRKTKQEQREHLRE